MGETPNAKSDLIASLRRAAGSVAPAAKKFAGLFRLVVFAAFAAVIVWRLHQLGFAKVLSSLPTSPWFYALFLVAYFTAPAFEMLIYGPLWRPPARELARALIQKRILNEGVLGYSGEAFFGWWARTRLEIPGAKVFAAIKDSNFVSSFASTTTTLGLAFFVMVWGPSALTGAAWGHSAQIYGVLGAVSTVWVLLYFFRRRLKLLSLDAPTVARFSRVHYARVALVMCLQLLQWSIAAPGVPFMGWLVLLATYLVVTRIPFMPSYDLVLLGIGLSLAQAMGTSEHLVAGLFLANAGLSQAMNLVLFFLLGRPQKPVILPAPTPDAEKRELEAA